eukprot:gnl/TRDRNA2_/TRDRNA2_165258_c0_seq10.p1 gnl/TRDRNA2_/TRDRNA2_165258_c0~~gnl/TRDRNA2_/TRDRNA2_165258_c0_seq10.p1  ORF type:complete len:406 (+),score=8.88 gnl/TRDRNA2_/TRDRNA2_165258_c0_seq10:69-1286(+)
MSADMDAAPSCQLTSIDDDGGDPLQVSGVRHQGSTDSSCGAEAVRTGARHVDGMCLLYLNRRQSLTVQDGNILGHDPACDICVPCFVGVSSRHLTFHVAGERCTLKVLSPFHCMVNNRPYLQGSSVELRDGDRVLLHTRAQTANRMNKPWHVFVFRQCPTAKPASDSASREFRGWWAACIGCRSDSVPLRARVVSLRHPGTNFDFDAGQHTVSLHGPGGSQQHATVCRTVGDTARYTLIALGEHGCWVNECFVRAGSALQLYDGDFISGCKRAGQISTTGPVYVFCAVENGVAAAEEEMLHRTLPSPCRAPEVPAITVAIGAQPTVIDSPSVAPAVKPTVIDSPCTCSDTALDSETIGASLESQATDSLALSGGAAKRALEAGAWPMPLRSRMESVGTLDIQTIR